MGVADQKPSVQIAIDGPAASGKSSAAKKLAVRLKYLYLDSGALYRAITLASQRGVVSTEPTTEDLNAIDLKILPSDAGGGCTLMLNGENVTVAIRDEKVSQNIHPISSNPIVRAWITAFLRKVSGENHVVMDGRDIGSVVFPQAKFKFFITATAEARANRRIGDLEAGDGHTFEVILEQIKKRDEGDRNRSVAPLLQVKDAILIDNSDINLEQTVERMAEIILKKDTCGV